VAVASGGPNKSGTNVYDEDNVVKILHQGSWPAITPPFPLAGFLSFRSRFIIIFSPNRILCLIILEILSATPE
jgi:hypothetical protein